ncbi:MAG: 1-acyl-sn-glycerol-3-phosphate acyltransferase [Acholeplasmataceae bacterium]|nr:1-acyl-sn-glycerol-3-phosphate acyltransferase [Acholeplasmataceae bacterium]
MRLIEEIGRITLKLIFYPKYHFLFTYKNFDPKRKDPYILISNHPSLHDPLFVSLKLNKYPYPVTGNLLYTNPIYNFLLTKIIKSIAKRKGQSDVQTIRGIIDTIHKKKRGIMLFPEGNASYFGQQSDIPLFTTAKLVKKIQHEVVLAKINGGYLAAPRWGVRRDKGDFHIHYEPLLTPQDINQMTVEQIEKKLIDAIAFNDYDWNREKKIIYKSNQKATGINQYIYACPKCQGIQTIKPSGNDILCNHCGKIAHINPYELIEGLPFDNFIMWDQFQKKMIPEISQKELHSSGRLIEIDFQRRRRIVQGDMAITLKDKVLILKNQKHQHDFHVDQIEGLVLTQKNFLSFDYGEKTFLIRINDPMLFMDSINYIKGE